jgi:hypothetical protein
MCVETAERSWTAGSRLARCQTKTLERYSSLNALIHLKPWVRLGIFFLIKKNTQTKQISISLSFCLLVFSS